MIDDDYTEAALENALRNVAEIEARQAAEDLARTAGWLAVACDSEFGTENIVGPFDSPVEAMVFAGNWTKELNIGGDPRFPYRVDIRPFCRPSEALR